MSNQQLKLDFNLIKKYEKIKSPYYTTYPTGGEWNNKFTSENYEQALKDFSGKEVPMALYVHIPFCKKLCYFCFCITLITGNREQINKFTQYLFKEIDMLNEFFKRNNIKPKIKEIHLGGGTPTYLTKEEFDQLIEKLKLLAKIEELEEFAMEIDPRTVTKEDMIYYYGKGINRISFGIQDFDEKVQKAVNRVHPPEMIKELLSNRKSSVNFDLIYGLPFQTRETFKNTIIEVLKLDPDRLSVYNYDYTPEIHKHMKLIKEEDLPSVDEKMLMYFDTIQKLLENGYEWVGIDHFAKTNDKLAKATRNGTLGRNLNGYTTGRNYDVELGIGPSSIGILGEYYAHNVKSLPDYYNLIGSNKFPVFRGMKLNEDDIIRRDVILKLICKGQINFDEVEKKYNISFKEYFEIELGSMGDFISDGLLKIHHDKIVVQPIGRIFVQHIAKVFDKYLRCKEKRYIRTHDAIRLDAIKAEVGQ